MTVSKSVSFVQELNKGITGTSPFGKLILVYEPVIFFLCFVRLDWGSCCVINEPWLFCFTSFMSLTGSYMEDELH